MAHVYFGLLRFIPVNWLKILAIRGFFNKRERFEFKVVDIFSKKDATKLE